jgi:hypothetical protein
MKSTICALALMSFLLAACSEVPGDAAYRSGHHDIAAQYYEQQYSLGSSKAGLRFAQMLSQATVLQKTKIELFSFTPISPIAESLWPFIM